MAHLHGGATELVFLSIFLGVVNSLLHLVVGHAVGVVDGDRLLFSRVQVLSGNSKDTVCVDIEGHFNLRNPRRRTLDALQTKGANGLVVLGHRAFALQNLDLNAGLERCRRAKRLGIMHRKRGIAFYQARCHAAYRFDGERKRRYIEQKQAV